MRDLNELFSDLASSSFRRRFKLNERERRYLTEKGLGTVLHHARDFISQRLAPAQPPNDGRQTPMQGHPSFVAQHATATCCRSCLQIWHGISKDRQLSDDESEYVIGVLRNWLERQMSSKPINPKTDSDAKHLRQSSRKQQQTLF